MYPLPAPRVITAALASILLLIAGYALYFAVRETSVPTVSTGEYVVRVDSRTGGWQSAGISVERGVAIRIEVIDGLTSSTYRKEVQRRFNTDPSRDPLRILLATDAAREGLNFQAHCADLFHFDLPWNPGRIEQRNGRIDRKLQPAP